VKPVIILDANLLAADVSDKGEISVEEIDFATIEFQYQSKHCKKGRYLIDIVRLEKLQNYITLLQKRFDTIYLKIEELVGQISDKPPLQL
jgi:hypothetical protein